MSSKTHTSDKVYILYCNHTWMKYVGALINNKTMSSIIVVALKISCRKKSQKFCSFRTGIKYQ